MSRHSTRGDVAKPQERMESKAQHPGQVILKAQGNSPLESTGTKQGDSIQQWEELGQTKLAENVGRSGACGDFLRHLTGYIIGNQKPYKWIGRQLVGHWASSYNKDRRNPNNNKH